MKKIIFTKISATLLLAGSLASCSSDYLQVEPETSVASSTVVATTEAAQRAIWGICNAMQTQWGSSLNQTSGEAWLSTVCNDSFGPDYITNFWQSSMGQVGYNWGNMRNQLNYFNLMPWAYGYAMISRANEILAGIDNATGSEADRNFIKAQAYTFRAYGYFRLLQFYAPRWEDSNNGEKYCVVLRTEPGTDPSPLVKMNEVLTLIYSDLDNAIALYTSSGKNRKYKWEPNINVAYGTYARTALLKHDWPKAQTMAQNARQGFQIMDNETYMSGFAYDNNDNIWASTADAADLYYWSHGSHYACNGRYVQSWQMGAGAISMNLYRLLDPNDIRRKLYFTPDKLEVIRNNPTFAKNVEGLTEADFWRSANVQTNNIMNVMSGKLRMAAFAYHQIAAANNPVSKEFYYTYPYMTVANNQATLYLTPFGAQYKFWGIDQYGTNVYPYMRSTEMCLTEAEAAYMNGDETTAIARLKEVNDKRIPGYTCNKTGQDLLDEIRLCRRIELWGEGFSFTDFKRWNLPCIRTAWVENDPTSGNQPPTLSKSHPVDENNGWVFIIHQYETQYNSAIDMSLLD